MLYEISVISGVIAIMIFGIIYTIKKKKEFDKRYNAFFNKNSEGNQDDKTLY